LHPDTPILSPQSYISDTKTIILRRIEEVENAVKIVLEKGYRTADIYREGMKKVGCREMGRLLVEEIKRF
ncbi:MAG: hypothetical protein ACREOB_06350, partial [Thermodesulfobacteriota bacterium]